VTAPGRAPGGAYEGAGRQVALAVRGYSSVIVTSDDLVAAAHTAIGIALSESAHRLVMIADLGGEVAPLQALVRDDDSHGIYDSFEFGTSFVRVAREIEGAKNFFVMPSGTESAAIERIIGSPKWADFASEFANADELLLIVCSSTAPALDKLAGHVDGAILVGIQKLEAAPNAHILARVPHPVVVAPPKIDLAPKRSALSLQKVGLAAAGVLIAGIAVGALLGRMGKSDEVPVVVTPVDSVSADSVRPAPPAIPVSNPADSGLALPYSVEISSSNTLEGANFEIKTHGSVMPAATISVAPIGNTEAIWYKVHSGAFQDSAEAEALLASLKRRRILPDSSDAFVVRAPLAMLVDSISAQAGMRSRVREKLQALAAKDVTAYALMQRDGSARIYVGAFQTPQQSTLAATALRVAGLTPVLAYRTGRMQ
jgi:hypothetical protein